MKVSLSRRERILIIGSLVAIILFVYMSLVQPRFKEQIEVEENKLNSMRTELSNKELAAVRLAALKEESRVLEAYLEAHVGDFFGTAMMQEEVLLLVRDFIEEAEIDAYELSLDESGTSSLTSSLDSYYKQLQAEASAGQPETPADDEDTEGEQEDKNPVSDISQLDSWTPPSLRMISVNLRFRSDYPSMMKFIQLLSDYSKRIGIETLTLSGSGSDPDEAMEGNIRIFLPALEMVETYHPTPIPDELEDNLDNRNRKSDPFNYPDRFVTPDEPEPEPVETIEPDEEGDQG